MPSPPNFWPPSLQKLPHVDKCRVCKVCITVEEEANFSPQKAKGGGALDGPPKKHQHIQQQRLGKHRRRQLLGRRRRRLQRLIHAADAALDLPPAAGRPTHQPACGSTLGTSGTQTLRRLAAGTPQIDGISTHAKWVAAHGGAAAAAAAAAGGSSGSNSGGAAGVEVVTGYDDTAFEWGGRSYSIAPRSILHPAGQIRTCPACRGCRHQLEWMPKAHGAPPAAPAALLDLLQRRLSQRDVINASVFDLLTSQCDRHAENVYVSAAGQLSLIDNDQAYGSSWRPCGVDSIFLPGTQKFEISRLGFNYVMKAPHDSPAQDYSRAASPLQLLDYRCHAPGAKLGTDYPPQVTSCLKMISRMTKQQVQRHYGFPQLAAAAALRRRASDMLSRGFEWTLQNGWPRNPTPARYRWAPPCCKMRGEQPLPGTRPVYACVKWERGPTSLPRGEPYFGGPWNASSKDTGSYALGAPPRPGHVWPKGWAAGAWLGDDDGGADPGYAPMAQAHTLER
ncbi:hypothetical protein MNEG_8476 [Monoraphidium neglectum]|uniref:PI3K/PI4K catalytic domain-containing protein n=1 Tax=Monoraphidium neglectum TaxID=145388 RepID=A0A0D2MZC6_9CHLO|nr:hypothetical protein MNEG_8476 [Monoraphidium neglectum]KIY99485.1 hypothetical protein MNEG_8476 [Monoraphidium neglectum]|eukprot:XP_013898505.1 hypothetical protein MNEG_8476 [Monoraphidium neglectum]